MTTTADQTAATEHPCYCGTEVFAHEPDCTGHPTAELGARFRFTIQASELGAALRNVAPFACTDDTLPVLTGVQLTVAADTIPGVPGSAAQPARREITLLATDRYTLARQTLTIDASDVTGAGSAVLPKELVKSLAAHKGARNWDLVTITAGDDDMITARDIEGNTSASRALPGDSFPRCGKMLDDFKPAHEASDAVPSIAFNPRYLARLAKIGNGQETATFTFSADGAAKPVRWECGEVTGLIMSIRLTQ